MGLSNHITAVLNFIGLLASIPIIGAGIWLASKPDNDCIHDFRWPVLILGTLVLLVSLAGFLGAYFYKRGLLAFYLFAMALLIAFLLFLLLFALIVTQPDGSYDVPGRAYTEYRLQGFSLWLRNHVTNSGSWPKISACLARSNICFKLTHHPMTVYQFFNSPISPLQVTPSSPLLSLSFYFVPQ